MMRGRVPTWCAERARGQNTLLKQVGFKEGEAWVWQGMVSGHGWQRKQNSLGKAYDWENTAKELCWVGR